MDEFEDAPLAAQDAAITGVLTFRAEVYWHYLDGMDLTDSQKHDILQTLWTIMSGFVDLGFGIDPVQLLLAEAGAASLEDEFDAAVMSNLKPEEDT